MQAPMTTNPMLGTAQRMANDRYEDLCKRYGDLAFRKSQTEAEMADVLEQIRKLNSAVPLALQAEQETLVAVQEASAKAEAERKALQDKVVEKMKHEQPEATSRSK